jgi:glycosyltransferase involved in cell wall biosynthesis
MNVLYVSKALVVAAYRDKLRALAAYCDVVAVVPARWDGHVVETRADDPPLERARAVLHGHNHLHVYPAAARILRRHRPDLVHIDEEPYSAVTAQLAWHCRRAGVPCCFFAWQNIAKRVPPPFRFLRGFVFDTARGGIAGTESAADVLRVWGWRGLLAVIPQFGVNPERFRPDPASRARLRFRVGANENELVVGFGGRLVVEKGVHLLIRALAMTPGVRLVILGDGPERGRLEALAVEAGTRERILFAGAVDSRAVPEWLAGLDALALPSLRTRGWMEQFGRILVEAMASGVPVIGSRSGEIPVVIGDAGMVVPEDDAEALGGAFAQLAGSVELRRTLGERGRQRVLTHYTQERIAERTALFYRQLLEAA